MEFVLFVRVHGSSEMLRHYIELVRPLVYRSLKLVGQSLAIRSPLECIAVI